MLLGTTDRDNLWQWTGETLICQPDKMKAAGSEHPGKDHRYLRLITEPGEVAEIIEAIMLNEF